MNTYLFYDLETSGLNRAFDQVLQFAAIRTDKMLNEIERHTIMIRFRPDVIYSPQAMLTTRISVADTVSGMCEFEAIKQIHGLLNEFGTISIGYNSLGFDDEFLRFSFYRNLLPPYTHQYNNGCRRMDMFPITIIYKLFKSDVLKWPELEGKPTLKLEHLSSANSLAEGKAHDAIVDVEATVALARKFFKEKKMWEYLDGYLIKAIDAGRISKLESSFQSEAGIHCTGLMVSSKFGSECQYQAPVLSIGNSIPYSNQTLWLRLDLPELMETTEDTVDEKTWVIRKRLGEPPIILPPLQRYMEKLDKKRISIVEENIKWLRGHPSVFLAIINYYAEFRYPKIPDLDADAALYQNGFLSRDDQELCREFHASNHEGKIHLINRFQDADTRKLAGRVLCRNYPENLPKSLQKDFKHFMKRINPTNADNTLVDYRGEKRTTPLSALKETAKLKNENTLDDEQMQLLNELDEYLGKNFL